MSKEKLESLKLTPVIIGEGNSVINQYPRKGTTVIAGSKIFLLTNDNVFKMPNIKGWSLTEVISFCNLIGLEYEYEGYGYVKDFNIEKNTEIDLNSTLKVTLEAKQIKEIEKIETTEEEVNENVD